MPKLKKKSLEQRVREARNRARLRYRQNLRVSCTGIQMAQKPQTNPGENPEKKAATYRASYYKASDDPEYKGPVTRLQLRQREEKMHKEQEKNGSQA